MLRSFFSFIAIVIVLSGIVFLVGPRTYVDTTIDIQSATIASQPLGWIKNGESAIGNIRDGLDKEIIYAYPNSKAKTPFSIVYIHGFSASKNEIRPVPDKIAKAIGANLFYTRLTGHGQDGEALGSASVNQWVNDVAEAVEIGHALGEKTIVIGTSMGGALVTWAASQPELADKINGVVMISPAYQLQAPGSFLLTMPWAEQLANLLVGPERSFEPKNALHALNWTQKYPTKAVLPLAEVAKLARETRVDRIKIPALFIYSPEDSIVDPNATITIQKKWGSENQVFEIHDAQDENNHVLAGDSLSPNKNDEITKIILSWLELHNF